MGFKSLAVLVIVLVIVVAVFVSNTTSLLDPILERLSLRDPEDTFNAVLRVDSDLDVAKSSEGYYTITYSVSNLGNATAQNVTLTTAVDGETQKKLIQSLSVSDTANYSRVVSANNNPNLYFKLKHKT